MPRRPGRKPGCTGPHRPAGAGTVTSVNSTTRAGPAVLSAPLRWPAGALVLVAAIAVVVLGVRYAGQTTSSRTDDRLRLLVATWVPDPGRVFRFVQMLGDPVPVVIAAGLLATACWASGRRRLAVLAVAGPGLAGVATSGLKPVFDRMIGGGLAYPSGHTAAMTALAIVAALLLVDLIAAGPVAGLLLLGAVAIGAGTAMGLALTALEVHYPTDTVGGFGTAVAVVLGAALLVDRIADRHAVRG